MNDIKYRILVAEDDEMTRELHAVLLRGLGYEVELAADGIEAVAKVGLGVDLVLTDAHMPNFDGFDVARQIRQTRRPEELPIVMVTSLGAREDRLRAYQVGINDFINKPVDDTELRLRLKWLLELKSAQDELRQQQRVLEETVRQRTADLRIALEEVTRAQRLVQEGHLDTIRRLTVAAEYKDHDTAGHIERIGRYARVLAEAMHLPPGVVDLLLYAAPMHDVGKLGIPDNILLKAGPLSEAERRIMNTHATIGAQILTGSKSPVIQMGERVALAHHERWDGSGYPYRLRGEEIPLEARICSVVDFYDALTMDRPYRRAVPTAEVVAMILAHVGSHFDPAIVQMFMDVKSEVEQIRSEYVT